MKGLDLDREDGFRFVYRRADGVSIVLDLDNVDAGLGELCEAFGQFLRGCGYAVDGDVVIASEPEWDDDL